MQVNCTDCLLNATTSSITSTVSSNASSTSSSPSTLGEEGVRFADALGLIAILLWTVVSNALVCASVKVEKRLQSMPHYFLVSMATLHITMATLVMPPAVMVLYKGAFVYGEELCKVWVTLELVFCNCTCLHVAFLSMDTFLRLKDPQHRLQAPPAACSLLLWLAAPWAISAVQGVAQFMLSQGDHGDAVRHNGVCFIADKNFLVLGSLFAFVIPAIVSGAFGLLCAREIRALRAGKMLDDDVTNESPEDSTSCSETAVGVHEEEEEETACREQVQLASVVTEPNKEDAGKEDVTSFSGHTNLAFVEHLGSATDQSNSCTLLLRDGGGVLTPVAEEDRCCPDEWTRHEQALSRLTLCLLVCCVAPWLPYALSNIVFALCDSCVASASQYSVLKWLAYCSAASAPLAQLRFSDAFRQAVCRILSCSCFRRRRTQGPPS